MKCPSCGKMGVLIERQAGRIRVVEDNVAKWKTQKRHSVVGHECGTAKATFCGPLPVTMASPPVKA